MTGQALLLLSDYASYMTGGEYFVDGLVLLASPLSREVFLLIFSFIQRASDLVTLKCDERSKVYIVILVCTLLGNICFFI